MQQRRIGLVLAAVAVAAGLVASQEPRRRGAPLKIGQEAPDFTLKNAAGKAVRLKDLRGKIVVLEWFSPACPWIVAAHKEASLKDAVKRWAEKGVVWLCINSNAPGEPGSEPEENTAFAKKFKLPCPILFDPEGEVGRKYGARTTPHVFVIDKKGKLAYMGAPDNYPAYRRGRADELVSYVDEVLAALTAGKKPEVKPTRPYG